ncbi:hypothetical protein ACQ4PT_010593 [Festuca glaucescens]
MQLLHYSPTPYPPILSAAPRRRRCGFLCSSVPGVARGASTPAAAPRGAPASAFALAANRVVLGCGLVTLDYLATVDAYPQPDDKIRSGELQISGGGNAGNALTGAARLGLNTRLISKIADGGNTTFVYVIIDKKTSNVAEAVDLHFQDYGTD